MIGWEVHITCQSSITVEGEMLQRTGSGALVSMKGSPGVGKNDVLYISVLQHNLHYIYVRDRPFNLKGGGRGYGFLFRSEIFFRTQDSRVKIFIFFVAQSPKFSSRI